MLVRKYLAAEESAVTRLCRNQILQMKGDGLIDVVRFNRTPQSFDMSKLGESEVGTLMRDDNLTSAFASQHIAVANTPLGDRLLGEYG